MLGRFFRLRVLFILIYMGVVGYTAWWVYSGWPAPGDDEINAEVSAVPGDVMGRMVIIVTNKDEEPWTDVVVTINGEYVHTVGEIGKDRYTVPLDDFDYVYAIPRDWSQSPWAGVSGPKQRRNSDAVNISPTKVHIWSRNGTYEGQLSGGAPAENQ